MGERALSNLGLDVKAVRRTEGLDDVIHTRDSTRHGRPSLRWPHLLVYLASMKRDMRSELEVELSKVEDRLIPLKKLTYVISTCLQVPWLVRYRGADTSPIAVKRPEELERCDAFVIPGGESATMYKLARIFGLL